jgi:hypothetical protein
MHTERVRPVPPVTLLGATQPVEVRPGTRVRREVLRGFGIGQEGEGDREDERGEDEGHGDGSMIVREYAVARGEYQKEAVVVGGFSGVCDLGYVEYDQFETEKSRTIWSQRRWNRWEPRAPGLWIQRGIDTVPNPPKPHPLAQIKVNVNDGVDPCADGRRAVDLPVAPRSNEEFLGDSAGCEVVPCRDTG